MIFEGPPKITCYPNWKDAKPSCERNWCGLVHKKSRDTRHAFGNGLTVRYKAIFRWLWQQLTDFLIMIKHECQTDCAKEPTTSTNHTYINTRKTLNIYFSVVCMHIFQIHFECESKLWRSSFMMPFAWRFVIVQSLN